MECRGRAILLSSIFPYFSSISFHTIPSYSGFPISPHLFAFPFLSRSRRRFPDAAFAAVVYKLAHGDVEDGGGSEERVGRSGHVRVNTHDGRTRRTRRRVARRSDDPSTSETRAVRTRDTRARIRPDRARPPVDSDGGGREDRSRAREPDDSPARDRVTDAPVRRKRRLGRGEPLGRARQHERLQGSSRRGTSRLLRVSPGAIAAIYEA